MDQPEDKFTKALERLRNHDDFHVVIAELRRMRDDLIRELAEANVSDSDMRQRLGFITSLDQISDIFMG